MRTMFIFIFLAIHWCVFSQEDPIKWNEISMDDLQMSVYENDTSASAIMLCDYGLRNISGDYFFYTRHVRIKILKPGGIKYAHIRIPFKDLWYQWPNIKGITYNLDDNGKILETNLKQKQIKIIDSADNYKIMEFVMPDVKAGSVIEYSTSIPTRDLISPEAWYFQNEIPTLYSEFRMRIPVQFTYSITPQNVSDFDVNEEKYYDVLLKDRFSYYRTNNIYSLYGKQIRLVKTNIAKFEYPNFVINPSQYAQSLKFHLIQATKENTIGNSVLASTTHDQYDLDPNLRTQDIYPKAYIYYKLHNWETVNSKLLKSDRFGLPLNKHWACDNALNEIIKEKNSPETKLIAIYDWIRKNMKWTGKYQIMVNPVFNTNLTWLYTKITQKLISEKSLDEPFKKQEGTSAEINFILIYLLNKAGIETHPVIVRTKDLGPVDTLIPERRQFNHVLALANLGEKQIFLDATDSLRPYNLLDANCLTNQAFLVKNTGYGWIAVKNAEETESWILEQVSIDSNLFITSKIQVKETGYQALEHRKQILVLGKDSFIRDISKKYNSLESLKHIDIQNNDDKKGSLMYEFQKSGKTNEPDILTFVPAFDPIYKAEDFKENFRKFSIDFSFPFRQYYTMIMKIPEGCAVKLPENKKFSTCNGNAGYQYLALKSEDKIRISIKLELKTNEFPANEYSNLKQLFTELNEKIQEEIIIKKLEISNL